jgi:hypothetical protein
MAFSAFHCHFCPNHTYITSTIYKTVTITNMMMAQKFMEKNTECKSMPIQVILKHRLHRKKKTILVITGIMWKCVKIGLVVIAAYCS